MSARTKRSRKRCFFAQLPCMRFGAVAGGVRGVGGAIVRAVSAVGGAVVSVGRAARGAIVGAIASVAGAGVSAVASGVVGVFVNVVLSCAVMATVPATVAAAPAAAAPASAPAAPASAPRPTTLQNGEFEEGTPDSLPPGWRMPTPSARGELRADSVAQGRMCAALVRIGEPQPGVFGNLMQVLDAKPYRGKRVRFSAQVRHSGNPGQALLWLRVDRPDRTQGFFDNMGDRPIADTTWKRYEIVGDVEDDAVTINLGMLLAGGGTAWIDDAALTVVPPGPKADAPPRPLSDRGLENLTAFAKLYGYVRHFHPSDPAMAADWDRLAMAGVEEIEGASDEAALATALNGFFGPIAPSVKVWVGGGTTILERPPEATHWVSWRHVGFGQKNPTATRTPNVYSSQTVREALTEGIARIGSKPGTIVQAELGGNVRAMIPIGVYADSTGTLPKASGLIPALKRPADWEASGNDRTTRLADVIIAWNVFQHFYPYFDITPVNWPRVLRESLRSAAADKNAVAFYDTLARLSAALEDGHSQVIWPGMPVYHTPLDCEWVGDLLVVVETPGDSISPRVKRGDVIVSINGRKTADAYAEVSREISAATEQWRRFRAISLMGASAHYDEMSLEIRHPDGKLDAARVHLTGRPMATEGSRPADGTEVAPGILYYDLVGMDVETMTSFLEKMAAAKGLIFDMRGYPGGAGAALFAHLTTAQVRSARWDIPVILMPDRQEIVYQSSSWNVGPRPPHFDGKIVFLTDGRAISYAESCLGIVEAYHLGDIVGAPTAGTNGNVNRVPLPGRYTITFTGMRVLKQDGSRHHGVGILPTVPASRTVAGIAAGKDELMEKAVEVLGGEKK